MTCFKCVLIQISILFSVAPVLGQSTFVPEIGDTVTYHLKPKYGRALQTKQTIQNIRFNDVWIAHQTLFEDGTEKLELSHTLLSALENRYITDLATFCEGEGGRIESVIVVAGEFETCKITHKTRWETWQVWYAAHVPMGIVKYIKELTIGSSHPEAYELMKYSRK